MEKPNAKLKILPYIINYYESSMTALMNKYSTINWEECEQRKKSINSAIAYLCRNLAELVLSLEYILTSVPDNESFIVEDFISEIHYITILLRSPVEGDIGELIGNVITAVTHISVKVYELFNKFDSNVDEFTEFEYQLTEIIFEIGSAYIKLMIFTTGRLEYEYLIASYKSTSEIIFSAIEQTLLKNDGIKKFEFIRCIKFSLKFLNNYQEYIKKTIQHPNTLAKVKSLLDTVSEYIMFQISTLTDAIDSDNPVDFMLNKMDALQNRYFATFHWVNYTVTSKTTKTESKELLHQGVLAFTEMLQNMSATYEIINCFKI